MRIALLLVTFCGLACAHDKANQIVVHPIKQEALEDSKVMDHLFRLTDVRIEKWGPFGRGWTYSNFSAQLSEPSYSQLIGYLNARTGGTARGEVIQAPVRRAADFEKWEATPKRKILIMEPERPVGLHTIARGRRHADAEPATETMSRVRAFRGKLHPFFVDEGVVSVLMPGYRGVAGTMFPGNGSSLDVKTPIPPPVILLTIEHYNRIARLPPHKVPAKVQLDVKTEFFDQAQGAHSVIAEIKGTKRPEQVVAVGAHLDSWIGATVATGNAAGYAVAIEALRIIKASNLKTDRTIKIALWRGEAPGLFGSRAHVKEYDGDVTNMQLKPEPAKRQAYFGLDNSGGKIRGVYPQANEMLRPIFEAWLAPFKDFGAGTLTFRNTDSTGHVSFNALGLPGFWFFQDPPEYFLTPHHSYMDVFGYVPKSDLIQASAILASFVYHAAARGELLPRKPRPTPQPERRGEGGPGAPSPSTT